jgi:hypothetical protein
VRISILTVTAILSPHALPHQSPTCCFFTTAHRLYRPRQVQVGWSREAVRSRGDQNRQRGSVRAMCMSFPDKSKASVGRTGRDGPLEIARIKTIQASGARVSDRD